MLIASPMPRVPPVTIATRAMILSLVFSGRALLRRHPTFKLAADQLAQHLQARGAVVEAGEVGEIGPAGAEESIAAADRQLLERLQAVGGEAGRDHGHFDHALARKLGEQFVGGRLEPFGAAEARLKGDGELAAERLAEQARSLLAVT